MTENRPLAVLDRPQPGTAVHVIETAPAPEPPRTPRPRRWNDPDERLMLWGMLGFPGLALYAVAFVALGMWLTP